MQQEPVIRVEQFNYRGQLVQVLALVHPWGDITQLAPLSVTYEAGKSKKLKTLRLPAGAMWRKNRNQARETEGRTERQCYRQGAHDLLRGGLHASKAYGLRTNSPGTETQELLTDRAEIRFKVITLMTKGASIVDLEAWAHDNYQDLVERYRTKRDIRKIMVRQNLDRAARPYDSLGRKNRPAMGMASGAAIGNLDLRRTAIRFIERYLDERSKGVADLIWRVRDTYRGLRSEFEPWMVEMWSSQDCGTLPVERINSDPGWLEMIEDRANWPIIKNRLMQYQIAFGAIRENPFLRNSSHALEDMRAARLALGNQDLEALREALRRLLEGTRWFFAQDYLQQRVIHPLSFLMEDLRRAERAKRRLAKQRDKIVITRGMDSRAFDEIICQFRRFVKRLGKIDDGPLKRRVKPRLRPIIKAVFAAMHEDDWLKVKHHLLKIAAIL